MIFFCELNSSHRGSGFILTWKAPGGYETKTLKRIADKGLAVKDAFAGIFGFWCWWYSFG